MWSDPGYDLTWHMNRVNESKTLTYLKPPEDIESGIQRMVLSTKVLYPNPEEHCRFETRLYEFLKIDTSSKIMEYSNSEGILSYLTESAVPTKQDSRPPLLLLFGNPAPDSVRHKCFFASEKGKREHRFWPILEKAGIISFKNTNEDSNPRKTRALFDLSYESPFRMGLAVFYSMSSPASDPKWSGVAGLRRLFGARALRKIAENEKKRVGGLINEFIGGNPHGTVIAFQKDAYSGVKDDKSQESVVAREGKWCVVAAQCSSFGIKLFRLPPTRYMMANWYVNLLREVGKLCMRA